MSSIAPVLASLVRTVAVLGTIGARGVEVEMFDERPPYGMVFRLQDTGDPDGWLGAALAEAYRTSPTFEGYILYLVNYDTAPTVAQMTHAVVNWGQPTAWVEQTWCPTGDVWLPMASYGALTRRHHRAAHALREWLENVPDDRRGGRPTGSPMVGLARRIVADVATAKDAAPTVTIADFARTRHGLTRGQYYYRRSLLKKPR